MGKFKVKILQSESEVPSVQNISAVFLIAFDGDNVLSTKNERGWDVPGGHLEADESLVNGLHREVLEEGGANFSVAIPYAILTADWTEKVMLFYVTNSFTLSEFISSEDVLDRDVLSKEELISRYYGDKDLLQLLIDEAQKKLNNF